MKVKYTPFQIQPHKVNTHHLDMINEFYIMFKGSGVQLMELYKDYFRDMKPAGKVTGSSTLKAEDKESNTVTVTINNFFKRCYAFHFNSYIRINVLQQKDYPH